MRHLPVLLLIFLCSCAPSRFVKPLAKGEKSIGLSIGGPLIGYQKSIIPIPLSSVTFGYGLRDNLTVFGSLHTTSMLFGIAQAEIGAVKEIFPQRSLRPGISLSPVLNIAANPDAFRLWPQLDINAYWTYSSTKHYFYAGLGSWFELDATRPYGEKQQTYWFINPHLGHTFTGSKWSWTAELKFLAPNLKNTPNVVDYKGINGNGAMGVYVGVSRRF